MKRLPLFLGFIVAASALAWAAPDTKAAAPFNAIHFPFYIYHGFHSRDNHFAPSGWMGDYGDVGYDDHYVAKGEKDAHAVIHIKYSGKGTRGAGWAGIYWQNPPNNWGSKPGGYNLNGAKSLVFLARGDKGGEIVDQFKVGGITGDYADSGSAAIGPITLTKDWKRYEISLQGQELSSITGGFCWTMNRDNNPQGAAFSLDNIHFE